jgi:hypothetical protein
MPQTDYLTLQSKETPYMSKTAMRRHATMQSMANNSAQNISEDLFAEKFVKVTFRDFSNNTRMDIKNVDLKAQ